MIQFRVNICLLQTLGHWLPPGDIILPSSVDTERVSDRHLLVDIDPLGDNLSLLTYTPKQNPLERLKCPLQSPG